MPSFNLRSLSTFAPSHLHYTLTRPFLFSLLSSYSSLSKSSNPLLLDYLTKTLNCPATRALTIASSTRYSNLKSLERPQAVVQYFQNLGFSVNQIQSSVSACPQILFLDVDKILKPKIEFFQQLGLADSHLGEFFSKNSAVFRCSLEKKLIPSVEVLKKTLVNDKNNEDLLKVLSRNCSWLVGKDVDSKLLPNIRFLESCGIIGDQLVMLLRSAPRLFTWKEAALRNIVSKVSDLGIDMHSRMFVHAVCAVSHSSDETLKRKVQTFERFGFSKDEYMVMVRKAPYLLNKSTKSLTIRLDFYLNTLKFKKEVLIRNPKFFLYSMENRVIPRYRVLEIIKCKRLLKKEPSFSNMLDLGEEVFLERFISKFADHKEELFESYRGHTLGSSSEEESSAS